MLSTRELTELAIRNYENLPVIRLSDDDPEVDVSLATPDRLTFALGWIVANAIVQARYTDSGIDAVPVFHPENGWDRFLLTRRLTAPVFTKESANSFGMIMLSGDDAPRITQPNGGDRLGLGKALREDAEAALAEATGLFPKIAVPSGKEEMGPRWKDRRVQYPKLYAAVTELIVQNPGMAAAREISVDDQQVDGAFHPLYLHGVAPTPRVLYDWFLVQLGDRAAFFRTHGGQAIYETDRGGWSTVKKQLATEDLEGVKERIAAWLRIGDRSPQKQTVD